MMRNWIHEQTDRNVAQFDRSMETHYPESAAYLHDPARYLERVAEECNYLDAVKVIDWRRYVADNSAVLDFGCGGGWLAGYLSTIDAVRTVCALDASKHFIADIMPEVIKLMQGKAEKIVAVEGLFTPLLLEDESLDVVAASSVLHHADSLEGALKEIRRVLKRDALLFILNETPPSTMRYGLSILKAVTGIFANLILRRYKSNSVAVSSCGYLANPYLGDRDFPLWYWKEAIKRSGFSIIEFIDSGMPTVKGTRGRTLKHFVCRAA